MHLEQKHHWSEEEFLAVQDDFLRDYPHLQPMAGLARFQTTAALLIAHCPQNGKVVDIGAWPGILAGSVARLGIDVTAVDKEPDRALAWSQDVLLGREGLAERRASGTFAELCDREGIGMVRADIERECLPLATNSVDVVILTEVIEHLWHDPLLALSEINRILKSDTGVLLLSTPNLTSLRHRLNFVLGRIDRVIEHPFVSFLKARRVGHLGHCRLYAPGELVSMLQLLGFEPQLSFTRYESVAEQPAPTSTGTVDLHLSPLCRPGRSGRRSLLQRVVRRPGDYWAATCATTLALTESMIPQFRPQIFIVARKILDADFDTNFPAETRQLVMTNSLLARMHRYTNTTI